MGLSDSELIAAFLAAGLPLVIAFVLRPTWSSQNRAIVAFFIVAAYTLLSVLFTNEPPFTLSTEWRDYVRLGLWVLVVTLTTHRSLWSSVGLTQRIEAATSPPSVAKRALVAEAKRVTRSPRTEER